MWLTHDCLWILTAACFSGDNVSPWTGARSSSLGENFWINLTALRLFCYSLGILTLWSGKTTVSVLHANLISCAWVGFLLSCFYKSNSSYLFCAVICSALAWFKSLGFVCSPSFFSLPAACRLFSRGVIFTRARVSLALLSLRKNGGLLVVYI